MGLKPVTTSFAMDASHCSAKPVLQVSPRIAVVSPDFFYQNLLAMTNIPHRTRRIR